MRAARRNTIHLRAFFFSLAKNKKEPDAIDAKGATLFRKAGS